MDAEWVEHLINKYSSQLLHYISNHTHNREDAEDILQDIFISVYEHCSEFDAERCNEQAWLYIIAKRRLVSYYRKQKDMDSLDAMEDYEVPGDDSMAQATNVMACRQAVALGMRKLDERSREVIVMRYFDGMSFSEIGEALGISEGNARVIQNRALKTMQEELGSFEFDEE